MKPRVLLLPLLVLSALAHSAPRGGEAATLSKRCAAIMRSYVAALKKKDVRKVEAVLNDYFAKGFSNVGLNGAVTGRKEMIASQVREIAALKSVTSATASVRNFRVKGKGGTGTGRFAMHAVVVDPSDPKRTHKLYVESTWASTFQKVGGKWMLLKDKTLSQKVLIDGKRVP